mgnify:CR=1 FL=1
MGQREERVVTVVNSHPEWISHSIYKGWKIYRARLNGRNCMCYGAYDPNRKVSVYGINLSDIKHEVSTIKDTGNLPVYHDSGIAGGLTDYQRSIDE